MPLTEISAGEMSRNSSTSQDQLNWPGIVERLFNQIITNRTLILKCIQAREPFRPRQPNDLAELMTTLRETDLESNTLSSTAKFCAEPRILASRRSGSLLPREMALSYHVIFEAIASMIALQITLRTMKKKQAELSLNTHSSDDIIGIETTKFNQGINNLVYDLVGKLLQDTLPYKIYDLSVSNFMEYIKSTYEDKIDSLDAESMELDLQHFYQSPRDFKQNVLESYFKKRDRNLPEEASWYHSWVRFLVHPIEKGHFGHWSQGKDGQKYYYPTSLGFLYSKESAGSWHDLYLSTEYFKAKCELYSRLYCAWQLIFPDFYNHDFRNQSVSNAGKDLIEIYIKTLRYMMRERIPYSTVTAKELLLLVKILSCREPFFHAFKHYPGERRKKNGHWQEPSSSRSCLAYDDFYEYVAPENINSLSTEEKNALIAHFPSLLHALIVKNKKRNLLNLTKDEKIKQRSQQKKTDIIIKEIHKTIAYDCELRPSYSQYLLNHKAIESEQTIFLQQYFTEVNKDLQNPDQKGRLLEMYRSSLAKETNALEIALKKFNSSASFFARSYTLLKQPGMSNRCIQMGETPTAWMLIGAGSYNAAYRSQDGELVFKTMHVTDPAYQEMDSYERSIRLWNEINPTLFPPARMQKEVIDGNLELGWVCPYVDGRQSTDEEMKYALIDIFNRTSRIVVDATAHKNFITTATGEVFCIDIGWALRLDTRTTDRTVSVASHAGWIKFEAEIFINHYHTYPQTIDTIKTMCLIKLKRPEMVNFGFLQKLDSREMQRLANIYDEMPQEDNAPLSPRVNSALAWVEFLYVKDQCIYELTKFIDVTQQVTSQTTTPSGRFSIFTNKNVAAVSACKQTESVCQFLLQQICKSTSIEAISQYLFSMLNNNALKNSPKITEDVKAVLGRCNLFVAKYKPELVEFKLLSQFLSR